MGKADATPADIEELRQLAQGIRDGAQDMQLTSFYDNDIAFHRKLWEMSGNPYLVDTLERLVVPLFAFFLMRNDRDRKNYIESADNHFQIVEDIFSLEAPELRRRVKESMTRWKDEMLERLFPKRAEDGSRASA